MGIKIEKININNLGPISNGTYNLNNINLIFSKNEGGKSILVEFILRSLFNKKFLWGYNRELGNGKIKISGIDQASKSYSPNSKDKLDKYFEKTLETFQASLPKLLVVKSGETYIDEGPDGINIDTLKKLLSSKNILDKIDSKIPTTIQNANFSSNIININSTGDGKTYKELKDTQLLKINKLLEKLNNNKIDEALKLNNEINDLKDKINNQLNAKKYRAYTLANEKKELENELKKYPDEIINDIKKNLDEYNKIKGNIDKINKELSSLTSQINDLQYVKNIYENQSKAKRYKAYLLDKQKNEIEQELNKITDDNINKLQNNISTYKNKKEEYQRKSIELEKLEEKYKDYNWVTNVKIKYLDLKQKIYNKKFSKTYLIIAALIFVAGLIISLFDISNLIGILLMLVGFGFSIYFSLNIHKSLKQKAFNDELENLQKSFKDKFNQDLNEASLDTVINDLDVSKLIARVKDELQNLFTEISNLKSEIEKMLFQIFSLNINEDDWINELTKYIQKRNELKKQILDLEKLYYGLNVDVADFYYESVDEVYDPVRFNDSKEKLSQLKNLEEQQKNKKNELNNEIENLEIIAKNINNIFINLLNEQITESEWNNKLNELTKHKITTQNKLVAVRTELEGLGIAKDEYLSEDPKIEYNAEELSNLEKKLKIIDEKYKELEQENLVLKNEITIATGSSIGEDWNILIERLNTKKKEILDQLRQKEAYIIAGIIVHQTINELLQEEEKQIQKNINSKEFCDLLYKITGKYNSLSINNDGKLTITSQMADYDLRDLSTGTKEQVLFALRVTLAEKILGNKAFFILDDAFQHSDYDRRPKLIDQLFTLADEGWQIIYLTMDDNIRDIFTNKGLKREDYLMIELKS
ncbi:MAG TPA: AAA family ATPase [Bacteroidales bacterium]|nr:AAA family ATPase [Bacteroidales bacterium]HPZ37030.1 AAA family ATPase [Bacteroidales bacterium]HQD35321.1 AAA family ATPase [Bacteroidales bacterium]